MLDRSRFSFIVRFHLVAQSMKLQAAFRRGQHCLQKTIHTINLVIKVNIIIDLLNDLTNDSYVAFVVESVAHPLCFRQINFRSDFHECLMVLSLFGLQFPSVLGKDSNVFAKSKCIKHHSLRSFFPVQIFVSNTSVNYLGEIESFDVHLCRC